MSHFLLLWGGILTNAKDRSMSVEEKDKGDFNHCVEQIFYHYRELYRDPLQIKVNIMLSDDDREWLIAVVEMTNRPKVYLLMYIPTYEVCYKFDSRYFHVKSGKYCDVYSVQSIDIDGYVSRNIVLLTDKNIRRICTTIDLVYHNAKLPRVILELVVSILYGFNIKYCINNFHKQLENLQYECIHSCLNNVFTKNNVKSEDFYVNLIHSLRK